MALPQSLQFPDNEIPEYTVVRIRNVDDKSVTLKWARTKYTIEPGREAAVPWPAMVRHMGDPRTIDLPGNDPRLKERTFEFNRLCKKYGVYDKHELFPNRVPKIEAYSFDGERIITVIDDPRGEHDTPERLTVEASMQNDQLVKQMMEQMQAMQAQIAALTGGQDSTAFQGLAPLQTLPGSVPATGAMPNPADDQGDSTIHDDEDEEVTVDTPHKPITKVGH